MALLCDEFQRCLTIEVGDKVSEVPGKAQEVKYADQLAVVRRGEGTFEVKVAKDNILLVGMRVFQTEAEMVDRP